VPLTVIVSDRTARLLREHVARHPGMTVERAIDDLVGQALDDRLLDIYTRCQYALRAVSHASEKQADRLIEVSRLLARIAELEPDLLEREGEPTRGAPR
jgi:hypothetical protein